MGHRHRFLCLHLMINDFVFATCKNLLAFFHDTYLAYTALPLYPVAGIPRWNWWKEGCQIIHPVRERPGEAQIQPEEGSSVGNRGAPCSWRPPTTSQCGY